MRVAGVDGYAGGWVAVAVDAGDFASTKTIWAPSLEKLVEDGAIDFALVDMPIGFTDGPSGREADAAARRYLGSRAVSVFPTPCRDALDSVDYPAACLRNLEVLGKKFPKQTWAIFPKMIEVDLAVRRFGQMRIREGHPEVSFAVMNDNVGLAAGKRTVKGAFQRLGFLARAGFNLEGLAEQLPDRHPAAPDDLADAAILAWSAERVRTNSHTSFPPLPDRDRYGLEMAIWA